MLPPQRRLGAERRAEAQRESLALYVACNSLDPAAQANGYETLWRHLYRAALQVARDQADSEAVAQDGAQIALTRIHQRRAQCRTPEAFLPWARRIVVNAVVDELRRRQRQVRLDDPEDEGELAGAANRPRSPDNLEAADLLSLLNHAPISARSRRVVVGRYWDGSDD